MLRGLLGDVPKFVMFVPPTTPLTQYRYLKCLPYANVISQTRHSPFSTAGKPVHGHLPDLSSYKEL
jgi:hypothetical protein